jgi:predicted transport protein
VRIFSTKGTKLVEITGEQFPLESEVQKLIEANLQELFDLVFVKSEFELHGLGIDTLAFDKESSAFVIIEYKKDRNFSVVDQGVAYLNLMLNNKADFILEYNEAFSGQPIKRGEIDWSQSRIIFISPEFTRHQQYAIGFKDLGIQLWEVHKCSNGLLVFNEAKSPFTKEPITAIAKRNPVAKRITEEIKVYTEEDHFKGVNNNIKELYQTLRARALDLGNDIRIKTNKTYIAFSRKHNFLSIRVTKSFLKLHLNIRKSELNDPLHKAKDIVGVLHASGLTEIHIKEPNEIQYVLPFIQQSYNTNLAW